MTVDTTHHVRVEIDLEPGTPLILTPAGTPAAVGLAEVISWTAGPAGLVVTVWAATSAVTAEQLDGRHVWMAGRTGDDVLIVLEAVARRGGPGELELTSVIHVASEYRRAAVRAAIETPAVLHMAQGGSAAGATRDLSSDGCRLHLAAALSIPVGSEVEIRLDLAARPVCLPGSIVRSSADGREVIVRFHPLPGEDAAAIDRVVFAALRR